MPDCVLWNAWVDKAKAMGDMDDEGYREYVCIGACFCCCLCFSCFTSVDVLFLRKINPPALRSDVISEPGLVQEQQTVKPEQTLTLTQELRRVS
jgi:hypothetical protein